jgi:hypothetical protein
MGLLTDVDAFSTEHRGCGGLGGGVDGIVWMACDCEASITRRAGAQQKPNSNRRAETRRVERVRYLTIAVARAQSPTTSPTLF